MRPTRHRRRFHTDRVVSNRRARYTREGDQFMARDWPEWAAKHLSYGALSDRDPWDCGNSRCGICHYYQWDNRRAQEKRAWRNDWDL